MKRILVNIIARFFLQIIKLVISNSPKEKLYRIFDTLINNHLEYEYNRFRKKYDISDSFKLNGKGIRFYDDGRIECGENSYIGELSTIQSSEGYLVKIGKSCAISHNVRIYTFTNISNQDFSKEIKDSYKANVIIEDFVWIGANVFICPGVTIGKNSIVGANSVVTKDVPPFTIVGGVPAKVLKYKTIKNEN